MKMPQYIKNTLVTGWKQIEGRWYYFEITPADRRGRMYRGEQTPDGYSVGEDGVWDGLAAGSGNLR